ncbi:MAG: carboxypeptidase-like regulatory domain-containing protein [Pseudomonadota bacterium]
MLPLASVLFVLCQVTEAQVFEAGAGVAAPDETVDIDLRFDSQGQQNVAGGELRLGFDPAVIQISESCRSRVGGTIFSTHRVSCEVDNSAGTFTIEFSSLTPMVPQPLVGDFGLGSIQVTLVDPNAVTADGLRQLLPTQIIMLESITGGPLPTSTPLPEGEAIFVPGWPIDRFEFDDDPVSASNLDESLVSNGDPFIDQQLHSLHLDADEDWSAHVLNVCNPVFAEISVTALSAGLPDAFHPIVQIYPVSRLTDDSVLPDVVLGNCDAAPAELSMDVSVLFRESRLIRVRNCEPIPVGGLAYRLTRATSIACPRESISVSGTVTDASTGQPVQVFVLASPNQFSVSNPVTGNYAITLLAGVEYTLTVISDTFQSNQLTVGPFAEGIRDTGNDLQVFRLSDDVFVDGFEEF